MKISKDTRERVLKWICMFLFLTVMLGGVNTVRAELVIGKKYDQTNYQEIQAMLPPSFLDYLKKGDWTIQTGDLGYEPKFDDHWLAESKKNEGKYDLSKDGELIEKATGKLPIYMYGLAFPEVLSKDPAILNDPKIAEKILENQKLHNCIAGNYTDASPIFWVERSGPKRSIFQAGQEFSYWHRDRGPLPNPNKELFNMIWWVVEPMDIRGISTMVHEYIAYKENTVFQYLPMLRRVRRVSGAATSDPMMGSELTADDGNCWIGKNASMKWKFLGQKTMLLPFSTLKMLSCPTYPDGSFRIPRVLNKYGWEVPGWKGTPWANTESIWVPRPTFIVEATPKDPYYNSGKQILYLDAATFTPHIKEVHDKAGTHWKTIYNDWNASILPTGKRYWKSCNLIMIDNKIQHATVVRVVDTPGYPPGFPDKTGNQDLPVNVLGPQTFTEAAMLGKSK